MNIQSFLYSRLASEMALAFSRMVPENVGYPLAERIGRFIGSLKSIGHGLAVRSNQWIISHKRLSPPELDRAAQSVFRFAGYVLYDFYHNLNCPEAIQNRVDYSPSIEKHLARCLEGKQGTLFVLPHMGNFDLAGRALAMRGVDFQVLSYPMPPGGYRLQNEIRSYPGMDVTPMSVEAMRQAADRLRNGGTVVTGLDRPLTESNYWPRFFGYPAAMPVAYIRLALKVGVPVIIAAITRQPGGRYLIDASEPIHLKPYPDLKTEMEKNAEEVLRCAEKFILRAPQQWLMFYPVWPQAINEMPSH